LKWTTPGGPVPAKLRKLMSGATLIDFVSLPAEGVQFSFDAAGRSAMSVQVFDQSYDFPAQALQRARPRAWGYRFDLSLARWPVPGTGRPAAGRQDPGSSQPGQPDILAWPRM